MFRFAELTAKNRAVDVSMKNSDTHVFISTSHLNTERPCG